MKYEESIDYVVESLINGQFKQARDLLNRYGHDPIDIIEYRDNYGISLNDAIRYARHVTR
jgi:hypothetical protein